MLLPDTHTHLEEAAFDGDRDAVVARAAQAGIDRILVVGSDLESSKRAIALARRYPLVFAAVGLHPHRADRFEEESEELHALLGEHKVVAIGEIGLDYYRGRESRELQLRAFCVQLDWARERGLPVSVHNREADDDVIDALRSAGVGGVLHCFSGSRQLAERGLDLGFCLSFAGNVTFPKAEELRAIASQIPLDRLLVETDAPVLAPQPWRGRRSEPAHVVAMAETLATGRDVNLDCLSKAVSRNADQLFGWRAA